MKRQLLNNSNNYKNEKKNNGIIMIKIIKLL